MDTLPLRLDPGTDLRQGLRAALLAHGAQAGFVLAGIGSLTIARLRLAGAAEPSSIAGPLEILTLCGSLAPAGVHLHCAVSGADGRVIGGHAAAGCIVHTTAEVLIALLPGWQATRVADPRTGYDEWQVRRGAGA